MPGFFEGINPAVHIYYNNFAQIPPSDPQAISTIWDNEPLIYFPNPINIKKRQNVPLIEVGGYQIELVILPPNTKHVSVAGRGIKVLWGQVSDGDIVLRAVSAPPPAFQATTAKVQSKALVTKSEGAVFISFTSLTDDGTRQSWKTNEQVPVKTLWKPTYSQIPVPDGDFLKFKQYDKADPKRDLYNLTGFTFRFLENKESLCHMQFWTGGKDVNFGVHNHTGDVVLEIHVCLFPGTGNGGIWRVKDGVVVDPEHPDAVPPEDFDKLPLGSLERYGGFWDRDCKGEPIRREKSASVSYPWHKLQAGNKGDALDIWTQFEFNPDLHAKLA